MEGRSGESNLQNFPSYFFLYFPRRKNEIYFPSIFRILFFSPTGPAPHPQRARDPGERENMFFSQRKSRLVCLKMKFEQISRYFSAKGNRNYIGKNEKTTVINFINFFRKKRLYPVLYYKSCVSVLPNNYLFVLFLSFSRSRVASWARTTKGRSSC